MEYFNVVCYHIYEVKVYLMKEEIPLVTLTNNTNIMNLIIKNTKERKSYQLNYCLH